MSCKWSVRASFVLCAITAAAALGQDTSTTAGRRHALLVGCTVYPALTSKYQLSGPGNDVALTSQLLREHYSYVDDEIVALVYENDAALQPTYDNIFREFAALIDRAAEGDTVFILLAGHGSQQDDDDPDNPEDPELDGLDEVFLPQDITEWKYNTPVVKAIRDDQIRAWLDAIRAKGASVFFVADTCHSGTIDRGGPSAGDSFYRERSVDREIINGPDEQSAAGAQPRPIELDDQNSSGGVADLAPATEGMGGLIALYAVNDDTPEQEHPMPPDSRLDGPPYGRLSYALNWVLRQSKRPLTYRELAQHLRWQYQEWGWENPGFLMGSADELDREVLRDGMWTDRSTVQLSFDPLRGLSINVGLLHGVTAGSVYVVYPPVGVENDDVPVGCVRVVEATATAARVETCSYGDVAETPAKELPAPARCELAYAAYGSLRMSVAVAPLGQPSPERLAAAEAAVRAIAQQRVTLIEMAAEGETPDAYVLVADDGAYLRRGFDATGGFGGEAADLAQYPPGAFGPFALDGTQGSAFEKALRAMAKALNVRSLAASAGQPFIGDPYAPTTELELVVERWNPETETFEPVDMLNGLDLYDRDKVRVQVFNRGGAAVDVTILYIESAFRIRSYFPTWVQSASQGFNNRITEDSAPASVEFTINDSTTGLEDVIVIATLAESGTTPQNFVFLEQDGLKREIKTRPPSPLEALAELAAFGVGERGGMSAPDIGKYVVHRLSWTIRGGGGAE